MLGKLIKHDLSAQRRLLIPLTLAIIAASLLCAGALRYIVYVFSSESPSDLAVMSASSLIMYVFLNAIAVIAYPTVVTILIMVHFYRNLYTDEGYLTFTLPVRTGSILLSKFLTAVLWNIISSAVVLGCFSFVVTFGTATDTVVNTEAFTAMSDIVSFFGDMFGASPILYLVELAATSLYMTVILFLAITIGSIIAKKHKVLASIGLYYAISIATSLVTNIVGIFMMIPALFGDAETMFVSTVTVQPLVDSIIYIGFAAAAYILTGSLMKNKLNLP